MLGNPCIYFSLQWFWATILVLLLIFNNRIWYPHTFNITNLQTWSHALKSERQFLWRGICFFFVFFWSIRYSRVFQVLSLNWWFLYNIDFHIDPAIMSTQYKEKTDYGSKVKLYGIWQNYSFLLLQSCIHRPHSEIAQSKTSYHNDLSWNSLFYFSKHCHSFFSICDQYR